jgi:hypothetical protein
MDRKPSGPSVCLFEDTVIWKMPQKCLPHTARATSPLIGITGFPADEKRLDKAQTAPVTPARGAPSSLALYRIRVFHQAVWFCLIQLNFLIQFDPCIHLL